MTIAAATKLPTSALASTPHATSHVRRPPLDEVASDTVLSTTASSPVVDSTTKSARIGLGASSGPISQETRGGPMV
jgi:hypothetical protein